MKDPYKTLEVPSSAGEKELKRAFRNQARRYHPDLNPGDAAAEERFKEVQAAYALLSDPEQRRRYDNGELEDSDYVRHVNIEDVDFASIFQDIFGGGWPSGRSTFSVDPEILDANLDHRITLRVPQGVRSGTTLAARTADNRRVQFKLPEGAKDGTTLKLVGKGYELAGERGDLYVKLQFT